MNNLKKKNTFFQIQCAKSIGIIVTIYQNAGKSNTFSRHSKHRA